MAVTVVPLNSPARARSRKLPVPAAGAAAQDARLAAARPLHGLDDGEQADREIDARGEGFRELGESPADGLNRQPEMIRDILPRHRQSQTGRRMTETAQPVPHHDEERCDTLFGRLSPEQHHLVLREAEFVAGKFVEPPQ